MRFGYIRVSTVEQSLEMQKNALKGYEVERWFDDDGISGKSMDRPGMNQLKEYLRRDDTLYVYSLSRLGRNAIEIMQFTEHLISQGVALVSHTESIDTTTPMGRMFFGMITLMGQLERELIRERTVQGLKTARDNGVILGRKNRLTPEQVAFIRANPKTSIGGWMGKYNVSRSTVMRAKRVE